MSIQEYVKFRIRGFERETLKKTCIFAFIIRMRRWNRSLMPPARHGAFIHSSAWAIFTLEFTICLNTPSALALPWINMQTIGMRKGKTKYDLCYDNAISLKDAFILPHLKPLICLFSVQSNKIIANELSKHSLWSHIIRQSILCI